MVCFMTRFKKEKKRPYLGIKSNIRSPKGDLALTGFTLIEVMISLVIASIMAVTVYSTYRSAVDAYEREKNRSYLYQDVKIIFEYLQDDIHSAFVNETNKNLVFIGRNFQSDGLDADSLELTTTSSFEADKKFAKFPLRKVKYFLLTNQANSDDNGLQRVVLWGDESDTNARATLGPLVKSIKFRYYDGGIWRQNWGIDETTGEPYRYGFVLPETVEVTLTIQDPEYPQGELVISKLIQVMAGYPTFHKG
jgi:type II secretion system protein J